MSAIEKIHFREVIRPLRTTFSTSLGQKHFMKSVIVKVVLEDGSSGLGECPTSFVLKEETVPAIKGIIHEVMPILKAVPIDGYGDKIEQFRKAHPRNPMTISGIEVALFRAAIQHKGISEHGCFGGRLKTLETDITIPFITDIGAIKGWIDYALNKKFTTYKFKISGNVTEDKRFFSDVYRLLTEHIDTFTIRLDGNQGFTEKTYHHFVDFLMKKNYPVELFEQPLPKNDYRGLKEIKKNSPFPVILDETVFNTIDLERVAQDDLCHGINIKVAKSGIVESLKLYNGAKKYGLTLMIGCMIETMVGLSVGINFAAGIGGFDYIDLDAIHFLHHRNSYEEITLTGPHYLL
jgi:L-alanine-DL-glutamate epimerase-like enolase superfamily enzyme